MKAKTAHDLAKKLSHHWLFTGDPDCFAVAFHKEKGLWTVTDEDLDVSLFTDVEFVEYAENYIAEFGDEEA